MPLRESPVAVTPYSTQSVNGSLHAGHRHPSGFAMSEPKESALESFGFSFARSGPHLARTMMFADLQTLLAEQGVDAPSDQIMAAIVGENLLGKPSAQARKLAARHLMRLYALDPAVPLYHAFTYLWSREPAGRPLLALLVAYSRDAVLRSTTPFILEMPEGTPFDRHELQAFVDRLEPGRFSNATLTSAAQNIAGTWTQSGHLRGRVKKTRQRVDATPASVALALLLGHVAGLRGELTFESEYVKLLDCRPGRGIELAETAAAKGWIRLMRIGSVVELAFPRLLPASETESPREQG